MEWQLTQEQEYWTKRWERNEIGWHLSEAHEVLVKNIKSIIPMNSHSLNQQPKTVFVPLCGKTLDIRWLRDEGFHIVGCELSELAVLGLFQEMGLKPHNSTEKLSSGKTIEVYQHDNIKIYRGNFFDLEPIPGVTAVFDRAALVALPPTTRELYTKRLVELVQGAPQLLVTWEHNRNTAPPHSITPDLVSEYYGIKYDIKTISRKSAGTNIIEAAYVLKPKL